MRLKLFFNRLPPACFISEPEFFISGEFVPFSDSESACSVVMDTMFGDEFDDSDSETETETETCQLWNLNFGWLHESTPQVDSNLLCGMFSAGNTDLSGTTDSSGTLHGALHRPVAFDYGLQGVEVEGDAEVSQDLISSNCHRIQLQTVGMSTFLNVHDTVSHEFELHRYSPVLHPLLSEIMMGDESQHWWDTGLRCGCNCYGHCVKRDVWCMGC